MSSTTKPFGHPSSQEEGNLSYSEYSLLIHRTQVIYFANPFADSTSRINSLL